MPTKLGKGGSGMQDYVPAGNPAGGQYGDNESGSNKHYFAHFAKQPIMQTTSETTIDNKPPLVEEEEFGNEPMGIESIDKPVKALKPSTQKTVGKMTDTDCYDYLLGFEGIFDENKIKNLSSEDLHNLVIAKHNVDEAANKNFLKTLNSQVHKELKEYELGNEEGNIAIWNKAPTTYEKVLESLAEKEQYFQQGIEKYSNTENKTGWLLNYYNNMMKGLETLEKLKNEILPKYAEQYAEAKQKQEGYEGTITESQELVNKYMDTANVYSQASKDQALWFQDFKSAHEYLAPKAKAIYNTIPKADLEKIIGYTGSYHFINEPLRNKTYYGSGELQKKFISYVKGMTNAINQSVLQENMWVQRGVNSLNINGKDLSAYNPEDLEGVVFEDQGFVSCGAAKGTGFTSNDTIMNIYCPKGTKALYVDPISHFGGENEIIIQRGYSFKITKVEKKGWTTYLDCEVILNSDIKKYNDEQLKNLQQTKFA